MLLQGTIYQNLIKAVEKEIGEIWFYSILYVILNIFFTTTQLGRGAHVSV